MLNFSSRYPGDLSPNDLFLAIEAQKDSLIDLSAFNPTVVGLPYPPGLQDLRLSIGPYEPTPQGLGATRDAVAREYQRQGLALTPDDLFLTTGTSEAYALVMKLMADPGQGVLFPTPGYPLLAHLSQAEGLQPMGYPLIAKPGWPLDRQALESVPADQAKVLVAITPHFPTGTYLSPSDLKFLDTLCAQNQWALVLDEVFWDYGWTGKPKRVSFEPQALTFTLGGLSKSCGLPQMKCSWMGLRGPNPLVARAKERLEFLADQNLSVGTPVQQALTELLRIGGEFRESILARVLGNRGRLERALAKLGSGWRLWPSEGGWSALVQQLDPALGDEAMARRLLDRGVWALPGAYFDFPVDGFWVISLLGEPGSYEKGLDRLIQAWGKAG